MFGLSIPESIIIVALAALLSWGFPVFVKALRTGFGELRNVTDREQELDDKEAARSDGLAVTGPAAQRLREVLAAQPSELPRQGRFTLVSSFGGTRSLERDGSPVIIAKSGTLVTGASPNQPLVRTGSARITRHGLVIDFLAARDKTRLWSVRKRWFGTWEILDDLERTAGLIRFRSGQYCVDLGGIEVARIREVFRFSKDEWEVELLPVANPIDPRLATVCALMIDAKENA